MATQDSAGNDYLHNCQAIVELDYVTSRTAGYAASIVSGYRRAQEKALYQKGLRATGDSYVGTVGERSEFRVTLLKVLDFESDYGKSYLHMFADENSNPITWWTSNPDVVLEGAGHDGGWNGKASMVKGATYRVKATVKEHKPYKGRPQTNVLRISVLPIAIPPKVKRAPATKAEMVEGVRAYAEGRNGGWSYVADYSDDEIVAAFGKARSVKGAIKKVGDFVWEAMRANSVIVLADRRSR